jgi:capsular polysaccharide export protein
MNLLILDKNNRKLLCLTQGSHNQKATIHKFAGLFSQANFIKFPRLNFRDYPESDLRAKEALSNRANPPKLRFLLYLNYLLLKFQYNWTRNFFEKNNAEGVVWNGLKGERYIFAMGCKDAGKSTYFLEGSPIPGKITVDRQGINYLNSLPRNIKFYLDWALKNQNFLDSWLSIKPLFVARPAKNNKGVSQDLNTAHLNSVGNFIFCPLQVPDDTQIRFFSGYAKSLENFILTIKAASDYLPTGWHVRIKEHPSSKVSYYKILRDMQSNKFVIDNSTDTFELIKRSEAVATINSSVGLQSLFFEKPVMVFGNAFYNIPDLVYSITNDDDLKALMSNPSNMQWNKNNVSAFLSFLLKEYYIFDR